MSARPEMTRRLGEAARAFKSLGTCWSHANISKQRKVEIFMACIASKVFYNIETLWLLSSDSSRLDAFHIRCLRRIYKIPPSFVSRVSNETVLAISGQKRFSELLGARQVHLYKKISDMHDNSF